MLCPKSDDNDSGGFARVFDGMGGEKTGDAFTVGGAECGIREPDAIG